MANYSWIFNILITEYDLEHYCTHEARRKINVQTIYSLPVPSDSEGLLHILRRSVSAVWGCGRVWFPMISVAPLPPDIEATGSEIFTPRQQREASS